jgi:hypothetical protein
MADQKRRSYLHRSCWTPCQPGPLPHRQTGRWGGLRLEAKPCSSARQSTTCWDCSGQAEVDPCSPQKGDRGGERPCSRARSWPSRPPRTALGGARGSSSRRSRRSRPREKSSRTGTTPCPDPEQVASSSPGSPPRIPWSRPAFPSRTAWSSRSRTPNRCGTGSVSHEAAPAAGHAWAGSPFLELRECAWRAWRLRCCRRTHWGRSGMLPRWKKPVATASARDQEKCGRLAADGATEDLLSYPEEETRLAPGILAVGAWLAASGIATASDLTLATSSALPMCQI